MKKENKLKLPARAALWYIASAAIGRGVTLIFTPIFTRALSAEQYGLYAFFSSWLTILTIPATLEIPSSVFMRSLQKHRDDKKALRSSALTLIFTVTAVFCILYLSFLSVFYHVTAPRGKLALLIFVQITLNSIINVYLADAKFSYRSKSVFFINASLGIFTSLFSLWLIDRISAPEWARIISQLTVSVVICIPLLFILFKGGIDISFAYIKELFSAALTLLPHYLSLALITKTDKLIIAARYGADALARYSVADTLGSLITIAIGATFSALVPWIMRKISAGENHLIRTVSKHAVTLLGALSVMLSAFAPELMQILAPAEYFEALFAFYPIALSAIPYFIFTVCAVAFAHASNGLFSSLSSLLGALTAICTSFVLSNFLPYPFISLSLPLAYFAASALAEFLYRRRIGNSVSDIAHSGRVFVSSAAVLLLSYAFRDLLVARIAIAIASLIPIALSARGVFGNILEQRDEIDKTARE